MQTWKAAVDSLGADSASSIGLWLNGATLVGIPSVASRHNAPSRAHAICSLLESGKKEGKEVAIIVSGLR